jgi:hypothetical protein
VSKIKRLRAVLTGAVTTALAVGTLPVLAVTAHAAADPLGGQPGPVTLSPTMGQEQWQPNPPAGTSVDDFMRHPVLSWNTITTLPVTEYRVQVSPNADFTNNAVTLPNGGLTVATQYEVPQTLPHGSYFWRVRGEDAAGHATLWTGTQEGDSASTWQFTKVWIDAPATPLPASGVAAQQAFSWQPVPDASAYEFEISQNPGFPEGVAGIETYGCTTNHTTFSPVHSFSLEPGVADGAVEGTCDDYNLLNLALQPGGNWYWRVRGLDGTTAALTPAETGVPCYTDGTDCSPWTATQAINFTATPAPGSVSFTGAAPTSLAVDCPAVVAGGTMPLCYDTPALSWAPAAGANDYLVETSADPLFTTAYHGYETTYSTFSPRESFLDNQAGRSYYWRVKSCNTDFTTPVPTCGATWSAVSAFHKASPALPLAAASAASTVGHDGLYVTTDNNQVLSTAVRQVRGNQLTFHWDDLLAYTQQAGIHSTQEAKQYRLEYTTTADWLTATTVNVDATHWTKQDGFLPDGGYYWRVAPIDGSGNVLAWSATQTVVKGTVAPTVSIGETGLLVPTSAVNLTFAAPVTGVTTATLGLREVGGAKISGQITWPAPDPSSATFNPDFPLLPGEKVVPWETNAVVDLAVKAAKATPVSAQVDPTVDSLSPTITTTWSKISTRKASGGSYAKAAGARDQITFAFTGSKVNLVGVRTPDGGYGTVLVDGVPRKTINFYAKSTAYGLSLYSGLLAEGGHVITLNVNGAHPKGS